MRSRFLLLTLIACPAAAQSAKSHWAADAKNGCRVWDPTPPPDDSGTISWSGACTNGLAQGRGVLRSFLDGKEIQRYEGELHDGKQIGRGVLTSDGGNRYEGEFRDNEFDGRGIFTSANGDRYEGEWRDSRPNGTGTLKLGDGQLFSGTWKNGCFNQGGHKKPNVYGPFRL